MLNVGFHFISCKVIHGFPFSDELGFAIINKHFGRSEPSIIIAAHSNTVGTSVFKAKDITFMHFVDFSVPTKCVGFADIANNRINSLFAFWVGKVYNVMIGIVKHRANEVV